MTPIFVKIRNDQGKLYDSYTDYWKLVELSGFATCEHDEIDFQSDNAYIFSPDNGNVREWLSGQDHTCKLILWYLERPAGTDRRLPSHFDEVWVSDRTLVNMLQPAVNQVLKYVTLGGHKDLGGPPLEPKQWDIVHIAYLYGKREQQMNDLKAVGYRVAEPGWGEWRDKTLARSRYGVCLHQDDLPIIEPLRYVLFACWQLPLVVERSTDYYPYEVHEWSGGLIANVAPQENYQRMTEDLTFRKCIEEAL